MTEPSTEPAEQDVRQAAELTFSMDTLWVSLPRSFPFDRWRDRASWAGYMTLWLYFRAMGEDPPPPRLDWAERTRTLIELGQQRFGDGRNRDQFLLFYDLEQAPLPVDVDAYLSGLPWDEVREMFSGAASEGVVEGPTIEPFEVDGAEVAQRSLYFRVLDPEERTVSANYAYTVRRDGFDILVRALFVDLATMRDGLPLVDQFVRGISVVYDATPE